LASFETDYTGMQVNKGIKFFKTLLTFIETIRYGFGNKRKVTYGIKNYNNPVLWE